MSKYYIHCDAIVSSEEKKIGVVVIGVGETTVDLRLDGGATLMRYGGTVYDENGEEIPLGIIKRDFLPADTASLLARIAQLEAMVTGGGTNV
ncbi:MAG: hypothetical protein Q4A66_02360 [Eubacteriales bacterium]|nr:hypothetical protein [Eubacteriales bacterium]